MKLFKRLLAAALVGVLALTMMVGCSDTVDPDTVIPVEQVVVTQAYQKLLNEAPENGIVVNAKYSRVLSNVANSMRNAANGVKYQISGEYSVDADKAAKAAFQKAIDDGTLPQGSVLCVGYLATNPVWISNADGFNYKNFYSQPDFENANTIGIICTRDDRNDVTSGTQMMMVAAYIPKTSK